MGGLWPGGVCGHGGSDPVLAKETYAVLVKNALHVELELPPAPPCPWGSQLRWCCGVEEAMRQSLSA